jgi:hypothetical protein
MAVNQRVQGQQSLGVSLRLERAEIIPVQSGSQTSTDATSLRSLAAHHAAMLNCKVAVLRERLLTQNTS